MRVCITFNVQRESVCISIRLMCKNGGSSLEESARGIPADAAPITAAVCEKEPASFSSRLVLHYLSPANKDCCWSLFARALR